MSESHRLSVRWSAIGAAVAVAVGAGGLSLVDAATPAPNPVTVTVTPTRILDTRSNIGLSGRSADESPRDLRVTGTVPVAPSGSRTVVPVGAIGVLVNVTVVQPSSDGFLSLRPADATGAPTTSTVNFQAGVNTPNAATVNLSPDGRVEIWLDTLADTGTAHVLLDVVGYTVDHDHDDRYYTKDQTDGTFATQQELDAVAAQKANAADVYTRSALDPVLADKVSNAQLDDAVTFLDNKVAETQGVAYGTAPSSNVTVVGEYQTILTVPFETAVSGHAVLMSTATLALGPGISANCRVQMFSGGPVLSGYANQEGENMFAATFGRSVPAGAHIAELQCIQDNPGPEMVVREPWITITFSSVEL
jgi:hypothetical protein